MRYMIVAREDRDSNTPQEVGITILVIAATPDRGATEYWTFVNTSDCWDFVTTPGGEIYDTTMPLDSLPAELVEVLVWISENV